MFGSSSAPRIIFAVGILVVMGFIAVQMFFSLTPPRHADHDHAMASLKGTGFVRIEDTAGNRRNLVGTPGRVLVLHFFRMDGNASEAGEAAAFARTIADDPGIEVLFVASAPSWDGVRERAQHLGIPGASLYLDKDRKAGDLLGVRRWPETLIYDPHGMLVFQAKGPLDWASPSLLSELERAKAGVEEIH